MILRMRIRYDISPDDGSFFFPYNFYSSLKNDIMAMDEYDHECKQILSNNEIEKSRWAQ